MNAGKRPIGSTLLPPKFLLFLGVAVAAAAGLRLIDPSRPWGDTVALAFDAAALVFMIALIPLVRRSDNDSMRRHSAENDANRELVLIVTTLITFVVMGAMVGEIGEARTGSWWAITKLVGTLALIWVFANSVYTLHYAHVYYLKRGRADARGLEFPGGDSPNYWDFAYFAFTLGMTFQTSDVSITDRRIRQIALLHCFAAFVFNLGVIAFTINALGGG